MKKIERKLKEINLKFEEWKEQNDKIIDIKDAKIPSRPKYKYLLKRKELIENLYLIKDGEETIISGGMLVWLFLGGTNEEDEQFHNLLKDGHYDNYLEEMKIRHRLKLLQINVANFDKDKIRKAVNEGGDNDN